MAEGFVEFGRLLRGYRRLAGLTQEALAERARVSKDTISNMERGVHHAPRGDTLELLADALGLAGDERRAFCDAAYALALREEPQVGDRERAGEDAGTGEGTRKGTGESVPGRGQGGCHVPIPPTPLIGRERELEALGALLRASAAGTGAADGTEAGAEARVQGQQTGQWLVRLLTLVGPPGVGKTRLAVEVARAVAGTFGDGAWFVDLAPLGAAEAVASAMAQALGLRSQGPQPVREQLVEYLQTRHVLLVLDNFEHLPAAAPLVATLLAASPGLTVMVTSRAALHLRGEQIVSIEPLPLPDLTSLSTEPALLAGTLAGTLAQVPSVALFVAQARTVQADFSLGAANALDVAAICCRLDGLPLAIELAAARIKLLPVPALLTQLDHRLAVLTDGPVDVPPHQRTLRATLDWSYHLLPPEAQMLFRRLSVFAGGATLRAIERVCCDTGRADADTAVDVLATVSMLMDCSLLQRVEPGEDIIENRGDAASEDPLLMPPDDGPRFRLLATLREYGTELLRADGELAELQQAHAAYFLALVETAFPYFKGPAQSNWLARLDSDQANVQLAFDWFEQQHDCERGLRLAAASWRIWYARGALAEARRRLDTLLTLDAQGASIAPVAPAVRGRALNVAGLLAYWQADYEHAVLCYQQSLALYRVLGDGRSIGGLLNNLGMIAEEQGDYPRAAEVYAESLAFKRQEGDQHDIALALNNLGALARRQGEYTRAIALLEESLALNRAVGDLVGRARILGNLGNIRREQGDCARARALLEEALALFRRLGDAHGVAYSLINLAEVAFQEADFARAEQFADEGLAQLKTLGDRRTVFALIILANVACERSEWQRAQSIYRESLESHQQLHRTQGIDVCLEGLALIAVALGSPQRAGRLVGAAAALRERYAIHLPHAERVRAEHICATVRTALLTEDFDAAWSAGQTMPLEDAIAEALGKTAAAALRPETAAPAAVPPIVQLRVHTERDGHNGQNGHGG